MKVLLALFCLTILINSGCKQSADPLEFDNIVSLAYSNMMTTNLPDTTRHKVKKPKEFKFFRIKEDSIKIDSCHYAPDCFIQVL
jgi:hypothetical protein